MYVKYANLNPTVYQLTSCLNITCIAMIECYRHLANDGFLAGSTDTFSNCLDSKSVEVRLQASQHVVQFVGWFWRTSRGGLSLGLDLMEMEDQSCFSIVVDIYITS